MRKKVESLCFSFKEPRALEYLLGIYFRGSYLFYLVGEIVIHCHLTANSFRKKVMAMRDKKGRQVLIDKKQLWDTGIFLCLLLP